MMSAAKGVFAAARAAGLTLDHRAVPLAAVAAAWGDDDGTRILFTTS